MATGSTRPPLGAEGQRDPALWREVRDHCRICQFWLGEPNCDGRLVLRHGGFGEGTWLIDYDDSVTDDDEPGYRSGSHRFVEGDYLSICDDDTMRTFKVAHIRRM